MKPAQTALNKLHAFGGGTIHLSDQWQTRGVVRKPEFTFANSGYIYINLVTFEKTTFSLQSTLHLSLSFSSTLKIILLSMHKM